MKKFIVLGIIVALILSACSKKENKQLLGGWKMVQMQMNNNGKITNYFSNRYSVYQTKMWTENHFMFVGKYKVDTVTTYRFGVGTYTLSGNNYVEDILYHFDASYEGRKNKIRLEIRNDTLLHIFPVNDKGEPSQSVYWIEKYVRLE